MQDSVSAAAPRVVSETSKFGLKWKFGHRPVTVKPPRADWLCTDSDETSTFRLPNGERTALHSSTDFTGQSAMTLKPERRYPSRGTYVLKVRGDAKPDALAERLEKLVTGRQKEFASDDELIDSFANDLDASGAEPPLEARLRSGQEGQP